MQPILVKPNAALPDAIVQIGKREFENAEQRWQQALRSSAEQGWQRVIAGLGHTPRTLRAEAQFYPRFRALLNRQVPEGKDVQSEEADHDPA